MIKALMVIMEKVDNIQEHMDYVNREKFCERRKNQKGNLERKNTKSEIKITNRLISRLDMGEKRIIENY